VNRAAKLEVFVGELHGQPPYNMKESNARANVIGRNFMKFGQII
jgi:hypothetical protein